MRSTKEARQKPSPRCSLSAAPFGVLRSGTAGRSGVVRTMTCWRTRCVADMCRFGGRGPSPACAKGRRAARGVGSTACRRRSQPVRVPLSHWVRPEGDAVREASDAYRRPTSVRTTWRVRAARTEDPAARPHAAAPPSARSGKFAENTAFGLFFCGIMRKFARLCTWSAKQTTVNKPFTFTF